MKLLVQIQFVPRRKHISSWL